MRIRTTIWKIWLSQNVLKSNYPFFEGETVGKIPTAIFINIKIKEKTEYQLYKMYTGLQKKERKKEK
jgi:hypothetical protein